MQALYSWIIKYALTITKIIYYETNITYKFGERLNMKKIEIVYNIQVLIYKTVKQYIFLYPRCAIFVKDIYIAGK